MPTVRDIMRSDVVTIAAGESARSLARLLADSEISGVPVVDGNDRVVGVASTTDLARLAAGDAEVSFSSLSVDTSFSSNYDPEEGDAVDSADLGFFLPEDQPFLGAALFEGLPESTFDRTTVGEVMTPVSFSVASDMDLVELSQYLVRGRIHRALVVDDGELRGIVTSLDVLRAVADGHLTA
ncbi:MAG: CBS domain-containing protein [Gemmatimonadetes bacterium]|nr:CBS domain-containing protein [Gemmatimonadota bacterium]NNL29781.1 CBS domain-containing protein [Gemmatimonadota bacterium]